MYSSIFFSSALALATVRAAVIERDISPFPSDTPVGTVTVNAEAQASAYTAALALSESDAGSDNVTADSIRLINFDGCSTMDGVTDAETQIYSGWQQAQKIMALQALKDGTVDFNTAGALDYLGASGLNGPRQGDMNTIFKNFATLTPAWWPLGWRVHVRCDDPYVMCSCGETAFAYTGYDDESKLARINFCPRYFKTKSLNSVLSDSKNLPAAQKYDMARYWETQGHVWTHELMHIDWVTGAYGPHGRYGTNEHVTDMIIQFTDSAGRRRKRKAYGPEMAKILARWPTNTGDYTIRNADNLALFMTSQYVQSQLNNAYPQYPLVNVDRPDAPPTGPYLYGDLFLFNDDGSVTLNETNPLAAAFADVDDNECALDQDEPNPDPMVFTSFAPDSAYPSDYISTLDADLASETWTPDSIMTAPPSLNTSTPDSSSPYCIPFQDPDSGIDGYCQCSGDGSWAYYSFASGSDLCPYTSPGPASVTIDPATVTGTTVAPITTTEPTTTSTAAPTPTGPVIGDTCVPNDPEWGCTSDKTEIIYCYCGDSDDCKWSSFGQCDGGSATCHLDGDGGNCGLGFGACC